jgi:hypothetical protein
MYTYDFYGNRHKNEDEQPISIGSPVGNKNSEIETESEYKEITRQEEEHSSYAIRGDPV